MIASIVVVCAVSSLVGWAVFYSPWAYHAVYNHGELIVMQGYKLSSQTNLTLTLIDSSTTGNSTTLVSYSVQQVSGGTYSNTNWIGPTMLPSTSAVVNIVTDGTVLFQSGHNYTIIVVSAKGNHFTFGILL